MAKTERENVLIVEDEELMRAILRQLLEQSGYDVFTADSAEAAIEIFRSADILLTLTDIKMSGRDGIELLGRIRSADPDAIVIIMTAYSSVETAVAALRHGAYDYVTKPFDNEDLLRRIRRGIDYRRLYRENRELRRVVKQRYDITEILGHSDALLDVLKLVRKVADTSANVLITGESGTGKELIARSLHFNSSRGDRPFLAVNCGALPASLLESELFGHVRGSFTGAVADKEGLLRAVRGGTLFLDEVGDMPAELQSKMLRALQEHEVMPVGSSTPLTFDARIVAATNKRLEDEIAAGRFREDLYYRLNVVEIEVPPLRKRSDDIPELVRHFINKVSTEQKAPPKEVSPEAMQALIDYPWPGNVRELEHAIERAIILSDEVIDVDSLPAKVVACGTHSSDTTLEHVERGHILKILASVDDDKTRAAQLLGIDLSTLYRKLKRYEDAGSLF